MSSKLSAEERTQALNDLDGWNDVQDRDAIARGLESNRVDRR